MAYSLINHLKQCGIQNSVYENLYAAWISDKQAISKALKAVTVNFPHYSQHDDTHSESIIKSIEMLLGEERIKSLSATDTWLILEAAYTHDLGMIVPYDKIVSELKTGEFEAYLKNVCEARYDNFDSDLCEAARYILNVESNLHEAEWPVKIRDYVTQLIAAYFRPKHAKNSQELLDNLKSIDLKFNAYGFIPNRLHLLFGDIALLHGKSFENILDLDYEANGYGTDIAHPRFIACMIRMGDLLDLDDGRFNTVFEKVMGNYPKTSKIHKDKHASIKHFLIKPQLIEITADCSEPEVYRQANSWVDWLKEEIKDLGSHWSEIVPDDFGGPPRVGKMKLLLKGSSDDSQVGLRFSISQEDAFKILEGSSIYNDFLVFIRELYQNALDASKIKMWMDIKSGLYDEFSKDDSNSLVLSKREICFPEDIPSYIWRSYPINFNIEPNNKPDQNEKYVCFSIEDRGCGISKEDLNRIANVGQSWKGKNNIKDFLDGMPYFLQITGAFGLGLQSIFLVSNEFKMLTKPINEDLKELTFVTRKENGYITVRKVDNKNEYIKSGTKVDIKIDENMYNQFVKLCSDDPLRCNFLSEKSNKLDYMVNIVKNSVKDTTKDSLFNVYLNGKQLLNDKNKWTKEKSDFRSKSKDLDEETKYYIEIADSTKVKNKIFIHLWNKPKASYVKLNMYTESYFGHLMLHYKDIPIDDDLITIFFEGVWNIYGGKTNEFLDISRESIKSEKKQELAKIYSVNLIPMALRSLLSDIKEDDKKYREIHEEMFILKLACKTYNVYDKILEGIGNNHKINVFNIKKLQYEFITEEDFFNIKSCVIAFTRYFRVGVSNDVNYIKKFLDHKFFDGVKENTEYIIPHNRRFFNYFNSCYMISKYCYINEDSVYLFEKDDKVSNTIEYIYDGEDNRINMEIYYFKYNSFADIPIYYPCRYKSLAVNVENVGNVFKWCNPSMVSPFITETETYFKSILNRISTIVKSNRLDKQAIEEFLNKDESEITSLVNEVNRTLITDKLVDYVIQNSVYEQNKRPSITDIKEDYKDFLKNFIKYGMYFVLTEEFKEADLEEFS